MSIMPTKEEISNASIEHYKRENNLNKNIKEAALEKYGELQAENAVLKDVAVKSEAEMVRLEAENAKLKEDCENWRKEVSGLEDCISEQGGELDFYRALNIRRDGVTSIGGSTADKLHELYQTKEALKALTDGGEK